MRTIVWFTIAAALFVALLQICEQVARRLRLAPEIGRKLAHISCGSVAAALVLVLPFSAIAILAALFIPFLITSRRFGLFPIIHSAERTTFGEIYFPAGILFVALLVPHDVEYVFGVLVLTLSDSAASLLGQEFGRRTLRFLPPKTYLGSAAFLLTTVGLGFASTTALDVPSGRAIISVLLISLALTTEEALLRGGFDNALLPVSAAAMLRLIR